MRPLLALLLLAGCQQADMTAARKTGELAELARMFDRELDQEDCLTAFQRPTELLRRMEAGELGGQLPLAAYDGTGGMYVWGEREHEDVAAKFTYDHGYSGDYAEFSINDACGEMMDDAEVFAGAINLALALDGGD